MEKLELVQYLFSLQNEEWERFELYLQSPYFTRKKLPLVLFRYLRTFANENGDGPSPTRISKQEAFEQIYPGEPFKAQRLRRVSMELKGLLIDFIALEAKQILPKDLEKEYAVRKHLLDRGKLRLYAERRDAGGDRALPQPFHSFYHFGKMVLERLHNEYFIHSGRPIDSLPVVIDHLDQYYLSSRMELWSSMINKERIYRQPHEYTFSEEVTGMILSTKGEKWSGVRLWWQIWLLHQPGKGRDAIEFLDRFISKKGAEIPLGQLRQIRGFMMNYLNWSMAEVEEKYLRLWWLLRDMLDEGTLYSEGKITTTLFRATVRSACLAGEWKWARDFLQHHGSNFKGEEVDKQLTLFRALVEFYSGDPEKALAQTHTIRFKAVRNEIYLKVLQVMCVFEMGDEVDFFRRAEAFRKYVVKGEDFGKKFAMRNVNFVRLILRIGKSRFHGQSPLPSLEEGIAGKYVAEQYWLKKMFEKWVNRN